MKTKNADKLFPGFTNAFDISTVKIGIAESFKKIKKDITVESCEISDVKYEPGNQCIILYRTRLTDNYFKKSWEQLFLGKVLKLNENVSNFPKEAIFSKDLGMIFSPFPYDPCMPWLPEAYSSEAMKETLVYLFPTKRWRIKNVKIKLLAYTPQMRATFLYTILAKDKLSDESKTFEWVAKTNLFKKSHRVFANYWALWKGAEGNIAMPKPTGFLINPQMSFQEKIEGIRLGAIVDDPNINQLMENVAKSIAHFHNLKIPVSHTRKLQQEIKTLNRWSNVLIDLRPDLKKRMELLREDITSQLEQRITVEAPIHADFHHTNILVHNNLVQIIDMDEMAFGDPCLDVGRFLSSLRIPSLRAYGSFDHMKPQRDLFIRTYLKHSPRDVRNIHLFESASLFTSAASAFRLQRKNWEDEVLMLLDESEQAFKEANIGKPISSVPAQSLPKNESILWAKDEMLTKTLLAPHIYQSTNREIISCEFKKIDQRKGYHRFSYQLVTGKGNKTFKDKIELFIHSEREKHFIYDYIQSIEDKLKRKGVPSIFPRPIAYLPELKALAFYRNRGSSVITLLGTEKAIIAAKQLAKGLASLHSLKVELRDCKSANKQLFHPEDTTLHDKFNHLKNIIEQKKIEIEPTNSYVIKDITPNDIKLFNDTLKIPFPIRKNITHPYTDIGKVTAKITLYGIQNSRMNDCMKFLDAFSQAYAAAANADEKYLALFKAEALIEEAYKIERKDFVSALFSAAEGFIA